jgi:hypothetical protein
MKLKKIRSQGPRGLEIQLKKISSVVDTSERGNESSAIIKWDKLFD